jgi:hypothetical protein
LGRDQIPKAPFCDGQHSGRIRLHVLSHEWSICPARQIKEGSMIGMYVFDTFDRITAYVDQFRRWRTAKVRDSAKK